MSNKKKEPFWNKKWGKDEVCPITQARLRPGRNKDGLPHCIFLPCGHGFYRLALANWTETNLSCPTCRRDLTKIAGEFKKGLELKD